ADSSQGFSLPADPAEPPGAGAKRPADARGFFGHAVLGQVVLAARDAGGRNAQQRAAAGQVHANPPAAAAEPIPPPAHDAIDHAPRGDDAIDSPITALAGKTVRNSPTPVSSAPITL